MLPLPFALARSGNSTWRQPLHLLPALAKRKRKKNPRWQTHHVLPLSRLWFGTWWRGDYIGVDEAKSLYFLDAGQGQLWRPLWEACWAQGRTISETQGTRPGVPGMRAFGHWPVRPPQLTPNGPNIWGQFGTKSWKTKQTINQTKPLGQTGI